MSILISTNTLTSLESFFKVVWFQQDGNSSLKINSCMKPHIYLSVGFVSLSSSLQWEGFSEQALTRLKQHTACWLSPLPEASGEHPKQSVSEA